MIVGFTGTRIGMTDDQKIAFSRWMQTQCLKNQIVILHHGDCLGADELAHGIAKGLGCGVVIHPPTNPSMRAFCKEYDRIEEPKHYLIRNVDIVMASDVLVAVPEGAERMRSGTWSTIRYAKKVGKPFVVISPSGSYMECG
jgi:hypothetical protein